MLRPPAMAKRADFFLSATHGQGYDRPLRDKAGKELKELLDSDGNHGVVQFYGFRHGLLQKDPQKDPQLGGSGRFSWELEAALKLNGTRKAKLATLAEQFQQQKPAREKLPELLRYAAGETEAWERLKTWQTGVKALPKKERNILHLSATDRLLLSEVERYQESPSEAEVTVLIQQAGEIMLPAGTEPLMAEPLSA
ncbi:MAG: hypothetical protein HQL52_15035 [Magnetococcales bacterium]|nr:hypothetical protein [Magnetococcales bacterium]